MTDSYKNLPLIFLYIILISVSGIFFSSCACGNIDSAETIKEYAIGTWMGCTDMVNADMTCLKFKINEDGTFTEYSTKGNSNAWGAPSRTGTWTVGKDNFSDTGNSYYFVELKSTGTTKKYPFYKGQLLMDYKSASEPGPYLSKGL